MQSSLTRLDADVGVLVEFKQLSFRLLFILFLFQLDEFSLLKIFLLSLFLRFTVIGDVGGVLDVGIAAIEKTLFL